MSGRERVSVGGEAETVRVRLLGGFSVAVGTRTIEDEAWRLRKAAGLVKLLALSPNQRLHREQAMDLLWPELGKKAASNNPRQALHAVRRTLTSDPTVGSRYLAFEDESFVLCPGLSRFVARRVGRASRASRRAIRPETRGSVFRSVQRGSRTTARRSRA